MLNSFLKPQKKPQIYFAPRGWSINLQVAMGFVKERARNNNYAFLEQNNLAVVFIIKITHICYISPYNDYEYEALTPAGYYQYVHHFTKWIADKNYLFVCIKNSDVLEEDEDEDDVINPEYASAAMELLNMNVSNESSSPYSATINDDDYTKFLRYIDTIYKKLYSL